MKNPQPLTDTDRATDRANAEAFARFRAHGGPLVDMTTGKVVRQVSATEARIHAGGSRISRQGARPSPAPQPKEQDPMKDITRAVRACPGANLSAKAYAFLASTHPLNQNREAFAAMSELDRHRHSGELANHIRMAEAAEVAPVGNPPPKSGTAIAQLKALLNDNFRAAVEAACAENEAETRALLATVHIGLGEPVASDEPPEVLGSMGLPPHLAAIGAPNRTEAARRYLCAKAPGFAEKSAMAQNYEAGLYLARGAAVL